MNQDSRLLKLPRELRDKILFEACSDRVLKISDSGSGSLSTSTSRPGLGYNLSLLLVCRHISHEAICAAAAAYASNEFSFMTTNAFVNFAGKVADKDTGAIRKLQIQITPKSGDDSDHGLFSIQWIICRCFTGLQELRLHLDQEQNGIWTAGDFYARVVRVNEIGRGNDLHKVGLECIG